MGSRPSKMSGQWRAIAAGSLLTVAAVCFAGWQLSSIAVADSAPQTARPVSDAAYLLDCSLNAVSQPSTYSLLCGNGTYALDDLRWESWGSEEARATGTYFEKECVPNCAQGMLQGYPVRVEADEARHAGTAVIYERLTVRFEGARPQWLENGDSISYDVSSAERPEAMDSPAK
ncbi:hypothetical protein ACFY5D_19890 [Paeniglutamicibacter sp. NPDC012692]|uniref:hypothetical protein n=1 Tax=Paeniglutamicibacter sp. NPDC012692 TaxID=3364388 RepID=UPI0036C39B73